MFLADALAILGWCTFNYLKSKHHTNFFRLYASDDKSLWIGLFPYFFFLNFVQLILYFFEASADLTSWEELYEYYCLLFVSYDISLWTYSGVACRFEKLLGFVWDCLFRGFLNFV